MSPSAVLEGPLPVGPPRPPAMGLVRIASELKPPGDRDRLPVGVPSIYETGTAGAVLGLRAGTCGYILDVERYDRVKKE